MNHGHVVPNPDGSKARCGGPGICTQCSREFADIHPLKPKREVPGAMKIVLDDLVIERIDRTPGGYQLVEAKGAGPVAVNVFVPADYDVEIGDKVRAEIAFPIGGMGVGRPGHSRGDL